MSVNVASWSFFSFSISLFELENSTLIFADCCLSIDCQLNQLGWIELFETTTSVANFKVFWFDSAVISADFELLASLARKSLTILNLGPLALFSWLVWTSCLFAKLKVAILKSLPSARPSKTISALSRPSSSLLIWTVFLVLVVGLWVKASTVTSWATGLPSCLISTSICLPAK